MLREARLAIYRAACVAATPHMARHWNRGRLLVIAYHGLRDAAPPPGWSWSLLPIRSFDRQVRYLHRHYRLAPLDTALGELFSGALREPTACITFDDGYRNNYTLGLDVLHRYRAPATVYLATGLIQTDRRLWTTELDLAFQQCRRPIVDLRPLGLDAIALGDVQQRMAIARRVIGELKQLPPQRRDPLMRHVRSELDVPVIADDGAYSFMTWDEVRSMEQSGWVRFGGHTVNHEIVQRLTDTQLAAEVGGSIKAVQSQVRDPSATFAYPNGGRGDFDERCGDVLRSFGCTAAVSTIEGLNGAHTDPFAIRRFNIGHDMTFDEFRLLTSGMLPRRARV
jgi:peptidoglycan/xylan/chitin deacetylase (PgdA/CDA1 family)